MFGLGPIRRWLTRGTGSAGDFPAGLGLAAADVAELAAVGEQVEAEYGFSSPVVLTTTLARLLRRRVPVRALREAGVRRVCGLQFADGTVVLVRARHAGDLGRLAAGLHFGEVRLDDFHSEGGRVTLEVSYGRHTDELCALGITQPG